MLSDGDIGRLGSYSDETRPQPKRCCPRSDSRSNMPNALTGYQAIGAYVLSQEYQGAFPSLYSGLSGVEGKRCDWCQPGNVFMPVILTCDPQKDSTIGSAESGKHPGRETACGLRLMAASVRCDTENPGLMPNGPRNESQ